jgi:heme-degrading monooxygenase HmoA
MIARLWRGSTASAKANDYVAHVQRAVLPELQQIGGYLGIYVLRRNLDDGVEFTVLTFWESMEDIRKFAGANADTAVVAPTAQALLRAFDSTVTHHEIVLQPEQKLP